MILILLDLSTAFDTVDHSILLNFHRAHVGVDGCTLRLFESYLTGRAQCVSVDGVLSELSDLAYGVPQGYVLGPRAFCIYSIPLGAILRHYKLTLIFMLMIPNYIVLSKLSRLMRSFRERLNASKI